MNKRTELAVINPIYIKNGGSIGNARLIIRKCFERFFYIKDKLYFLGKDNIFQIAKSVDSILLFFNEFLSDHEIYFFYEKNGNKKKILILDLKKLIHYLIFNQVSEINYKIDFFNEKTIVKKQKFIGGDKIHIIFNKFSPNEILRKSVLSESEKQEIINDYYNHFPDFDLFLDFVASARFAADRKATYLHLHTRSNWGKSFLMGVFGELGLGYEIRYSDISENKPVGINPLEVLNSIVLFLDEFKYFSKEMKKITTEMTIEPKFGFKSKVPVYAKVLLSAEASASFKEGVDEQILNRVIKLDYSDTTKFKKLDERKVYRKYGGESYFMTIVEFVKNAMTDRINKYIFFGREKAAFAAENKLRDFASKFRLDVLNLEDELLQIFINFFDRYKIEKDKEDNKYKRIASDVIFDNSDQFFYILNTTKTLTTILKIEVDDDFFAKAKYKIPLIKELLGGDYNNRRIKQLENKQFKCLRVDVRLLRFELLQRLKKFEFIDTVIEFENFEDLAQKINDYVKDLIEQGKKTNEVKETLVNWGLSSVFVFVKDITGFIGVEIKDVKPDTPEIPF